MSRFENEGSQTYDQRITKLIPGYELLHQLTAAKLTLLLPEEANILVVGAGTGKEILQLSKLDASWQFTALDPSEDMLDIAQSNFKQQNINNRVDIHVGKTSGLNHQQRYHAVLCQFVMHFMPKENKRELLSTIHSRLKPGGSLLISDLMKASSEHQRLAQAKASNLRGLPSQEADQMLKRMQTDFYPLDIREYTDLLKTIGFCEPTSYFQALRFQGFHAQKPTLN